MKSFSIQQRMGVLFSGFAVLIFISIGATLLGIRDHTRDGLVINLAGRQRMLVQQMQSLALQIDRSPSPALFAALQDTIQTFESTLAGLGQGGEVPYSPGQNLTLQPTLDPSAQALLAAVTSTWGTLKPQLTIVQTASPGTPAYQNAQQAIAGLTPTLTRQADQVTRRYEELSEGKVTRLRTIQAGFLAAALILLGSGLWATREWIVEPIQQLKNAAQRIGEGDLSTPVAVRGPEEIALAEQTLEAMRSQVSSSQAKLHAWAAVLEEHVVQRTRELEALNTVSQEIASNLEIGRVLSSVTEKTHALLNGSATFLCLLDEQGQTLRLHAASAPEAAVRQDTTPVGESWASQVIGSSAALRCTPQGANGGAPQGCSGQCQIMAAQYRASHLAAPLRSRGRVIGALCVGSSRENDFNQETEKLLTRLAGAAALALNNAQLYSHAERAATLEERQRLASEIHDGLAQTILYLRIMVDRLGAQTEAGQIAEMSATLPRLQQAIDQAEQEVRSAIASFQETFPGALSLQEQLARLASSLEEQSPVEGFQVRFVSEISTPLVRPPTETEQIIRVAREAISNAQHHSQAQEVCVRLQSLGQEAVVTIEDHGVGFNPWTVPAKDGRQHFGLKIMQARAARLCGRLEIQSRPGQGAQVRLSWPLRSKKEI